MKCFKCDQVCGVPTTLVDDPSYISEHKMEEGDPLEPSEVSDEGNGEDDGSADPTKEDNTTPTNHCDSNSNHGSNATTPTTNGALAASQQPQPPVVVNSIVKQNHSNTPKTPLPHKSANNRSMSELVSKRSQDNSAQVNQAAEARLKQLESLFLSGPGLEQQSYSMETLLDVLIVLHDECLNSSLRREKTVSDFLEYGEWHGGAFFPVVCCEVTHACL